MKVDDVNKSWKLNAACLIVQINWQVNWQVIMNHQILISVLETNFDPDYSTVNDGVYLINCLVLSDVILDLALVKEQEKLFGS